MLGKFLEFSYFNPNTDLHVFSKVTFKCTTIADLETAILRYKVVQIFPTNLFNLADEPTCMSIARTYNQVSLNTSTIDEAFLYYSDCFDISFLSCLVTNALYMTTLRTGLWSNLNILQIFDNWLSRKSPNCVLRMQNRTN